MTKIITRTRFLFRFYWLAVAVMALYALFRVWWIADGMSGAAMIGHGLWVFAAAIIALTVVTLIAGHLALALSLIARRPKPEIYYFMSWVLFVPMTGGLWWFYFTSEPPINADWLTLFWFLAYYYLLNAPNFDRYVRYFYNDA